MLNVATGVETSVLALARAFGVEVLHGPSRGGEVTRSCLDPSAAARTLGWHARIPLSAGLSHVRTPLAV